MRKHTMVVAGGIGFLAGMCMAMQNTHARLMGFASNDSEVAKYR